MAQPVAEIWTFPTDPAQFDDDERISFSKLDNKYIAVQDDGTELEFDAALKRWIPIADEADEALIEQQQQGYIAGGSSSAGDATTSGRKRKQDPSDHGYGYEVSCAHMHTCTSAAFSIPDPSFFFSSSQASQHLYHTYKSTKDRGIL